MPGRRRPRPRPPPSPAAAASRAPRAKWRGQRIHRGRLPSATRQQDVRQADVCVLQLLPQHRALADDECLIALCKDAMGGSIGLARIHHAVAREQLLRQVDVHRLRPPARHVRLAGPVTHQRSQHNDPDAAAGLVADGAVHAEHLEAEGGPSQLRRACEGRGEVGCGRRWGAHPSAHGRRAPAPPPPPRAGLSCCPRPRGR
jgi:hypothetical protein